MSLNPEAREIRKGEAFDHIEFLTDHGFEAVLLAKNLSEYMPLVQQAVSTANYFLKKISDYIISIDSLEREISEKRLNTIRINLSNLTDNLTNKLGNINENADQK